MVACQVTDRVSLTKIDEPDRFGSTYLLREVSTEASNTSGLSAGGGAIWLGANGPGASRRGPRPTDAPAGEVVKSDPLTGKTLDRWKLPVPGGTHGLDYDNFEDDVIWVTSTGNQTLLKMKISDWVHAQDDRSAPHATARCCKGRGWRVGRAHLRSRRGQVRRGYGRRDGTFRCPGTTPRAARYFPLRGWLHLLRRRFRAYRQN